MQSHGYIWPYMHFGVWKIMSLDPSGWYIDPKNTFLLILKGYLGCLLVYNYSLMYLDLLFCNGLKIAVFHSEAN